MKLYTISLLLLAITQGRTQELNKADLTLEGKLQALSSELNEIMALSEGELSIQSIQNIAIQQHAFEQKRFEALKIKSNQQAWLPILDTGFALNQDFGDERQKKYSPVEANGLMGEKERLNRNQYQDGYQIDIGLKWDFSSLLFNPQEVAIARESRYSMREKNRLLEDLTVVYFDRLKVKIKLLEQGLSDEDRLALKIKLLEFNAQLDAYTQGEFSKALKASYPHQSIQSMPMQVQQIQ